METFVEVCGFTPEGEERFKAALGRQVASGWLRAQCLAMLEERLNEGGQPVWAFEGIRFEASDDDLLLSVHEIPDTFDEPED